MSRHFLTYIEGGRSENEFPCKKELKMMAFISTKITDKEKKGKRCTNTHTYVHTHPHAHMHALTFAQSLLALSPPGLLIPKE